MAKKGIYAFLAVLTVFVMVLTACPEPESESGTKVTLSPTTLTVEIGENKQITSTPSANSLTWTSSDMSVATVQGGYVRGVALGKATITAAAKDGGKATCVVTVIQAITSDVTVEGDTLVHNSPKLAAANRWGGTPGKANEDGSYTFDGTSSNYNGDGAQYNFPVPKANDTWRLFEYDLVEITFKTTEGSVQAIVKKSGENVDLIPYPSVNNGQNITFNSGAGGGALTYKTVIGEAGSGVGFQRNTGGPATVAIEKVVFSKGTIRTITFTGLENATITSIEPIKIPDGRTVNFGSNYTMPSTPKDKDAGKHFTGWRNKTDNTDFNAAVGITKNIELEATWADGPPIDVDMRLDLNPASWPDPLPPNAALTGGSPSFVIPAEYAEHTYANGVLTFKFDGRNRQRAIVPLNAEQIQTLMDQEVTEITFRIDADIAIDKTDSTAKDHEGAFRLHLGDPSATSNWNGTNGTTTNGLNEGPLENHLVELRTLANKNKAALGWFIIQAMYAVGTDSGQKEGFAPVTITIRSVSIDIGDTTNQ